MSGVVRLSGTFNYFGLRQPWFRSRRRDLRCAADTKPKPSAEQKQHRTPSSFQEIWLQPRQNSLRSSQLHERDGWRRPTDATWWETRCLLNQQHGYCGPTPGSLQLDLTEAILAFLCATVLCCHSTSPTRQTGSPRLMWLRTLVIQQHWSWYNPFSFWVYRLHWIPSSAARAG